MPKKRSYLPTTSRGFKWWREGLWTTGIAASALLAGYAVVYLLSLPVPLAY